MVAGETIEQRVLESRRERPNELGVRDVPHLRLPEDRRSEAMVVCLVEAYQLPVVS
jgi:hypothetical protein